MREYNRQFPRRATALQGAVSLPAHCEPHASLPQLAGHGIARETNEGGVDGPREVFRCMTGISNRYDPDTPALGIFFGQQGKHGAGASAPGETQQCGIGSYRGPEPQCWYSTMGTRQLL